MADTFSHYSRTVEYYHQYRPHYPQSLIPWLRDTCALTPTQTIADIGSGTGQLTELFLQHGNSVYAIEPNPDMRQIAEKALQQYPNVTSLNTTAEATTLPDQSIDLITVGNAFHWFDRQRTRAEFLRILVPHGWVVLAWNLERNNGSPFAHAFEQFWQTYIDPTEQFLPFHKRKRPQYLTEFFGGEEKAISLDNYQVCHLEALKGVVLSTLKAPQPDDPRYLAMMEAIEALFNQYQVNGSVTLEYDTALIYGQLLP